MNELIVVILIANIISILISSVGLNDLGSPDSIYTDVARERYVFWHGLYWQCILINLVALIAFLVCVFVSNTGISIFAGLAHILITGFGIMSIISTISDRG